MVSSTTTQLPEFFCNTVTLCMCDLTESLWCDLPSWKTMFWWVKIANNSKSWNKKKCDARLQPNRHSFFQHFRPAYIMSFVLHKYRIALDAKWSKPDNKLCKLNNRCLTLVTYFSTDAHFSCAVYLILQ